MLRPKPESLLTQPPPSIERLGRRQKAAIDLLPTKKEGRIVKIPVPERPSDLPTIQMDIVRRSTALRRKVRHHKGGGKSHTKKPSVSDQIDRDFRVPIKVHAPREPHGAVELHRLPSSDFGIYAKVGVYSSDGEVLMKPTNSYTAALNKLSRWFGPVAWKGSFRRILQIIVVCGFNRDDFKSLIRLKDMWVRGQQAFPKMARKFANCLPLAAKQHAGDCLTSLKAGRKPVFHR